MTHVAKKDTTIGDLPEPGTWRLGVHSGVKTAYFRCPKCPTYTCLFPVHKIDKSGNVTPTTVCPGRNCDFFEPIQLEGWS